MPLARASPGGAGRRARCQQRLQRVRQHIRAPYCAMGGGTTVYAATLRPEGTALHKLTTSCLVSKVNKNAARTKKLDYDCRCWDKLDKSSDTTLLARTNPWEVRQPLSTLVNPCQCWHAPTPAVTFTASLLRNRNSRMGNIWLCVLELHVPPLPPLYCAMGETLGGVYLIAATPGRRSEPVIMRSQRQGRHQKPPLVWVLLL